MRFGICRVLYVLADLSVLTTAPKKTATVSYAQDCPTGWEPAPVSVQNELCYKLLAQAGSYYDAPTKCTDEHTLATMAMPKSSQEAKAVASKAYIGDMVWIGLNDNVIENSFVWEDGEAFVASDYTQNPWKQGNPTGTTENCVVNHRKSNRDFEFDDTVCTYMFKIVCQIDLYDVTIDAITSKGTTSKTTAKAATSTLTSIPTTSTTIKESTKTIKYVSITQQTTTDRYSITNNGMCCACSHGYTRSIPSVKSENLYRKLLSVNKRSLSSHTRKKTCAHDTRISSRLMGWFGALIISTVFGCIGAIDFMGMIIKEERLYQKRPRQQQKKTE